MLFTGTLLSLVLALFTLNWQVGSSNSSPFFLSRLAEVSAALLAIWFKQYFDLVFIHSIRRT